MTLLEFLWYPYPAYRKTQICIGSLNPANTAIRDIIAGSAGVGGVVSNPDKAGFYKGAALYYSVSAERPGNEADVAVAGDGAAERTTVNLAASVNGFKASCYAANSCVAFDSAGNTAIYYFAPDRADIVVKPPCNAACADTGSGGSGTG